MIVFHTPRGHFLILTGLNPNLSSMQMGVMVGFLGLSYTRGTYIIPVTDYVGLYANRSVEWSGLIARLAHSNRHREALMQMWFETIY